MNKIILALDTTNLEEAIDITKKIKDKIFTVKLGLEFFNAHGKNGVKEFNKIGIDNLMLDLKLKDIPETVYRAIKALDNIQFGYLTIHGQGGKKLIEYAKKAGFVLVAKSEINSNSKDTKIHPKGVWTLPPTLRLGDEDREKYIEIGESDRMTLKFMKPE